MAQYIFDTSPLVTIFRYYFKSRFPTLWEKFDTMISNNMITSTREVLNELKGYDDDLKAWGISNQNLFPIPTKAELDIVTDIFSVPNFQNMVENRKRLQGGLVADPFVIARAKCLENGCVVTSEVYRPHLAKIPNVCEHFKIECIGLEEFMEREDWKF